MISRMVVNKYVFHSDHLLLDPSITCADPTNDKYYGDINMGTWYTNKKRRKHSLQNHILIILCTSLIGC